jgi:hypothetical protein
MNQPQAQAKKKRAKSAKFFASKAGQHLMRKRRGVAYDPREWAAFDRWGD